MVYQIDTKGVAIMLMIISLCLLGTWPALLCLLERRGRKPQHSFLDYSITNYLIAVIFAMTLGDIGHATTEQPNFATQIKQDNGPSVGYAVAGGVFLVVGNMATQYSLAYLGVSLTEVIASSITVVMGTTMNYFLDDRINKASILFSGVGCFFLAIIFGYFTHHSTHKDREQKLDNVRGDSVSELTNNAEMGNFKEQQLGNGKIPLDEKLATHPGDTGIVTAQTGLGTAEHLQAIEGQRAMKVGNASWTIGLMIVTTAGVSYGLFSPAFNLSTNDQWHNLKAGVPKLVIYTAFFYFSTAFTIVAWILNITFLYFPILGAPKSSLTEYIMDNSGSWLTFRNGRMIALIAGLICGLGNGFQFMAGQAAGYAAADAVQALPLVSTIWGVILFGEYRRSSSKTYILLTCMLSLFAAAVALLCSSAGDRKN